MNLKSCLLLFLTLFPGFVLQAAEPPKEVLEAVETLRRPEAVPDSASLDDLFSCLQKDGLQSLGNAAKINGAQKTIESERSNLLFWAGVLYQEQTARDERYSLAVLTRILERPDITPEQADEALKLFVVRKFQYRCYTIPLPNGGNLCQYLFPDPEEEEIQFAVLPAKFQARALQYLDWGRTQFYEDMISHQPLEEKIKTRLEAALTNQVLDAQTFWWAVDGYLHPSPPLGEVRNLSKSQLDELARQVRGFDSPRFTEEVRAQTLEMLKLYALSLEWDEAIQKVLLSDSWDGSMDSLLTRTIEEFRSLRKWPRLPDCRAWRWFEVVSAILREKKQERYSEFIRELRAAAGTVETIRQWLPEKDD